MVLGIGLIIASLAALIYGIKNHNRKFIIISIIILSIIAIIVVVYNYLYSLNPY